MSGDALLKVYNCIIFPHFNYCCTVWSGAKINSNIDRLLKLQKRAARIILNVSEITTPSSILFQNLDVLSLISFDILFQILHNDITKERL
jgi:hypothetical protein